MDAWLDAGLEPPVAERRSILSRLTRVSMVSSSADGALHSRTAIVEQVGANGAMLTVRLMGSGLHDDLIPNPRIVLTARPASGPHDLVVVNGLARIQSHMAGSGAWEVLLLDVAIQRMECWGAAAASPTSRPAMPLVEELAAVGHDSMALRQA